MPAGKGQIKVGSPVAIIVPDKKDIEAFANYTPEDLGTPAPASPSPAPAPEKSTNSAAPQAPAKSSPAPSGKSCKIVYDRLIQFNTLDPPHVTVGMPALSPTMESGAIIGWTKKAGDRVTPGDMIADVETDKATIGFETTDEGYIAKVLIHIFFSYLLD